MAGIQKGGELVSAPHVLVYQYSPFLRQIHAMQAMSYSFNSYLIGTLFHDFGKTVFCGVLFSRF